MEDQYQIKPEHQIFKVKIEIYLEGYLRGKIIDPDKNVLIEACELITLAFIKHNEHALNAPELATMSDEDLFNHLKPYINIYANKFVDGRGKAQVMYN